ncbi:hypothetical protein IU474_27040 [Nocardia otitidiscaviarum]|uniref:DUF6461 domain-containing protein n=1 Tax=Nocardia otitidiscaviarum TaxID=1823 RepID=UPI001893CB6F|nr:DUF6461 domain-containing protein [Nocardia otitidiscaviarum]MBF6240708.1 hypothetical protein [Nocardia otitidiscaviarum]
MGWKVQGLFVEGVVDPADLPEQPSDGRELIEFDEVFRQLRGYGVSTVGGWTCIADPQFRVAFDDEAVRSLSRTGRALAWVTNSVSTVHGFAWYIDGVPVRRIVHAEGAVVDEYGPPLPEEVSAPGPFDEDHVFEMMARLAGLRWGEIADAPHGIWRCAG